MMYMLFGDIQLRSFRRYPYPTCATDKQKHSMQCTSHTHITHNICKPQIYTNVLNTKVKRTQTFFFFSSAVGDVSSLGKSVSPTDFQKVWASFTRTFHVSVGAGVFDIRNSFYLCSMVHEDDPPLLMQYEL